ncbi:MAG: hypothetical protein ACT4PU_01975 [Planctomycetota bacterium]
MAVGLGVALRLLWARQLGDNVAEWESEGFLRVLEQPDGVGSSHVRALGHDAWLSLLGSWFPGLSIAGLRLLAVGVSVLGLLVVLAAVAALSLGTRSRTRSMARAAVGVSLLWAVHPSLIASSVSFAPEATAALGASLLLACLALWHVSRVAGRSLLWTGLAWAAVTVALAASWLLGGIVLAAAVLLGLLIYLLPVPPWRSGLPVLLAGLAAAVLVGQFPRVLEIPTGRLMDSAPVHSWAALLEISPTPTNQGPSDVRLAEQRQLASVTAALREADLGFLGRRFVERVVIDGLGPGRFGAQAGQFSASVALALGLFDMFLRGGLLLFAIASMGLWPAQRKSSSWPRAGVAIALVAWFLLSMLSATNPLSCVGFDLLLLTLAGVGLAAADRLGSGLQGASFALGGLLLVGVAVLAQVSGRPLSNFIVALGHDERAGAKLVADLAGAGPSEGPGHSDAAVRLIRRSTPFLRLPEAARRHAELGLRDPVNEAAALDVLMAVEVDALRFDEAEALARTLLDSQGQLTKSGSRWLDAVREARHRRALESGAMSR